MKVFDGIRERIDRRAPVPAETRLPWGLPRLPPSHTGKVAYLRTPEDLDDVVAFLHQRPLTGCGIDCEFQFEREPVRLRNGRSRDDIRGVRPLLLSLAAMEREADGVQVHPVVIDLRDPLLRAGLERVLRLPVVFVGHYLKAELHVLQQLDLPVPDLLWDTWVCERALHLGFRRASHGKLLVEAEDIRKKEESEEDVAFSLALANVCRRHGIPHAFATSKGRLQQSFLSHPLDTPFSEEQVAYAAEDAVAAAALYLPQVQEAALDGVLDHLVKVEMPWVRTMARMEWSGVEVDAEKARRVIEACDCRLPQLLEEARSYGIDNPGSHKQLREFFEERELLERFRQKGGYSFDRRQLKAHHDAHPIIPALLAYRRVQDIRSSELLRPDFVGADGRVHPEHVQLGADSGRQTSRAPNILGLEGALRPLVVAAPGYGIGEVDLSQIEVGIAGAVYDDAHLVNLFNTGDVYSAMAQRFYRDVLSDEDRDLPGLVFKKKHKALRDKMKSCTLGIIYGLTPPGLARDLEVPLHEAERSFEEFLGMFPSLKESIEFFVETGQVRGNAQTMSGLRRYRAPGGTNRGDRNWFMNHPVQAGAAVVFKHAGNKLDRLYPAYGAKLLVPFHDAYVFEAPLDRLEEVAELTRRVMIEAVQEYFPQLCPRADINISRPDCWNKDGRADLLERWLADPSQIF